MKVKRRALNVVEASLLVLSLAYVGRVEFEEREGAFFSRSYVENSSNSDRNYSEKPVLKKEDGFRIRSFPARYSRTGV